MKPSESGLSFFAAVAVILLIMALSTSTSKKTPAKP